MCPQCVRRLTQCQKTKPSLFSSIPTSLKNGCPTELIQILLPILRTIGNVGRLYTHGPIRSVAIRNNACRVLEVIWSLFTLASMLTLRANLYWREYV